MAKTNSQPLKGFRDITPSEAKKRQWLIEKIKSVFELWGFDPIETPTLEPLEIFLGQVGEDEKLFYKFKDPGDRDVALRYDQTVPTARFVSQYKNELPFPFKRYQIQPVFRAEKPQKGRYREFLQCDADIFGSDSALVDAEVIALSIDIYLKLGFKQIKCLINDRELLGGLPYEAIVAIDKLKKIGLEGVVSDMVSKGIEKDIAKKYVNKVKNLKPSEKINEIFSYLKNFGINEQYFSYEPTLARSFSYSTGVIWEIEIPKVEGGSVLGGERFDKLVGKISGEDIPAVGFALGFDRTLEALDTLNLIPKLKTNSKVLVTIFNKDLLENSLKTTKLLRDKKIPCECYCDPEVKLTKQLKYADRKNIPFALIIGPDEAKNENFVLKDLESVSQTTLNFKDVVKTLRKANG